MYVRYLQFGPFATYSPEPSLLFFVNVGLAVPPTQEPSCQLHLGR